MKHGVSTDLTEGAASHRDERSPKAVIFDFDGVILESSNIKTEAFLELFDDYPQHRDAILKHHVENVGISRYRKFEWIHSELLKTELSEHDRDRLGIEFSEIVLDRILSCDFVPGARELLERLHPLARLFVASGTPQEELEHIVRERGLEPFFTEVWGTPSQKPEIIRSIMSRFELQRHEVVFVGDGMSDYAAASEVGIRFIGRHCPFNGSSWEQLEVESVRDLTQLPDKLYLNAS